MKRIYFLIVFLLMFIHMSFCQSSMCDSLLNIITLDNNTRAKSIISKPNFDINCISEFGSSPLGVAARRGNIELVKYLLKKGADPNIKQNGKFAPGRTPIFDATFIYEQELEPNLSLERPIKKYNYKIKDEIVKLLIKYGADIYVVDDTGGTLLMWASTYNRIHLIELFIKIGVNINTQDKFGSTALMDAVANNHPDITKLLLEAGADISLKDNKDQTALDTAKEKGYADIVDLLQASEK